MRNFSRAWLWLFQFVAWEHANNDRLPKRALKLKVVMAIALNYLSSMSACLLCKHTRCSSYNASMHQITLVRPPLRSTLINNCKCLAISLLAWIVKQYYRIRPKCIKVHEEIVVSGTRPTYVCYRSLALLTSSKANSFLAVGCSERGEVNSSSVAIISNALFHWDNWLIW